MSGEPEGQFPGRQGKAGKGEINAPFRRLTVQVQVTPPQGFSVSFAVPLGKKQASSSAAARVSATACRSPPD